MARDAKWYYEQLRRAQLAKQKALDAANTLERKAKLNRERAEWHHGIYLRLLADCQRDTLA